MPRRWFVFVLLSSTLAVSLPPAVAEAIPVFARRYSVSCSQCHDPIPRLNAFGDLFAGHGLRMVAGESPTDTLPTDDPLLALGRSLPLAVRFDAHVQLVGKDPADPDFQAPFGLKLLSSAPLSPALSYYFYFFLSERGEVGGVEDAFVQWNDVGGRPLDLSFGQFQISDPLFKRELRLMYDDYAAYRARMGDQRADLTYDRGFLVALDALGFTVTAELVNGNGRGAADNGWFDDDPNKNLFAHVTRDIVAGVRVGAMGYAGWQKAGTAGAADNRFWYAGVDATLDVGPVQLNGQYLRREDEHPTFDPLEARSTLDGGFVEALLVPAGERWYAFALWNRLKADRPILDPRMGGPAGVSDYASVSGGAGWLAQRNVRVQLEGLWDFELEDMRWTVSTILAH